MLETPFGSRITETRITLGILDAMILGFIIFLFVYFISLRKKKTPGKKCFYLCLLFMYCTVLVSLTQTILLPAGWQFRDISKLIEEINWEPVTRIKQIYANCKSIGDFSEFYRIIGGNFIMLTPLGILVPLINPKFKFLGMLFLSAFAAFLVEFTQFIGQIFGGGRNIDIDDFLLNASGCFLAYLIFAGLRKIYEINKRPPPPPPAPRKRK